MQELSNVQHPTHDIAAEGVPVVRGSLLAGQLRAKAALGFRVSVCLLMSVAACKPVSTNATREVANGEDKSHVAQPHKAGRAALPAPANIAALPADGGPQFNRLIHEKSPYLLQHARNPVDWYPWGEAAFARARTEGKPVFLSIGYSTCHWCHVMERESFEDADVAKLMNEAFVAIKVDREERPDIDNVYMAVCQMMTGSGGWPLTIIMTPDKKPFFAGTYFPKQSRFGRIGMMELVPRVSAAWRDRREELLASAEQVVAGLRQESGAAPAKDLDEVILETGFDQLLARFDPEYGGFGQAPKFPTSHNLLFLLRYWKRTGNKQALQAVRSTLDSMRRGGVWDHVGFGFHRYSTDREWLVPHFEKMLYDQALIAMAYTAAYQATGRVEYRNTAKEIFTYVLRDMTSANGGFYSAEDADSEGEEGKFYVWTADEIRQLLDKEAAALTIDVFGVQERGNYAEEASRRQTGANILHLSDTMARIAAKSGLADDSLRLRLQEAGKTLFAAREKRVHPYKDDKILTDWNGLMIAALARAAGVFGEPAYAEAATAAVDFILTKMRDPDGRLLHRFRGGTAGLSAHVDDYAFIIWGLIELYEATFEVRHLERALELNDQMLKRFWDHDAGGFYFTATDSEALLTRQKQVYDGARPSGNSVAMLNMLRLARMTANAGLEEKANELGMSFSGTVNQSPAAHTMMLCALDFGIGPSYEVVIVGTPGAEDTRAMLAALRQRFIPNKVVLLRPAAQTEPVITRLAGFTAAQEAVDGKATAYVCVDYNCKLPTTDPARMIELLTSSDVEQTDSPALPTP